MKHCDLCNTKNKGQHREVGPELLCPRCVMIRQAHALDKLKAALDDYTSLVDAIIRANQKEGKG